MNNTESLKAFQYRRMLEERRGHNFAYLTNELYDYLTKKGFQRHKFNEIRGHRSISTGSENVAKEIVKQYREDGCFSRIICVTNKIRIKEFTVWYKKKLN